MPNPTANQKHRPRQFLPRALLTISFLCNCAALYLPFMILRKGFDSEAYTLFHSVSLLWDEGLYILSLLVVGFSILFPFAKLVVLARVAFSASTSQTSLRWLRRVERLGKWSMLDVYLVSIILSLASRQFFVGAKAQAGLALFIVAVLLSMCAGELIARQHRLGDPAPKKMKERRGGAVLILSGASLIAALVLPFLRIEDWLLANRELSIIMLVPALWVQGAWLASILTAAFLVATPIIAWTASFLAWRSKQRGPSHSNWTSFAQRWSMLDVFGLALVVFAIESDHLMKTEIHWGALFLGATLAFQAFLFFALEKIVTLD